MLRRPALRRPALRRAALLGVLLLVVLAGGGVAVARTSPTLTTSGPTSVTGTAASAVFTIADRTVRQVRYADGGTLRYTFRLTNDDRLPVTVRGLADSQPPSRLFHPTDVTPVHLGRGETADVTLALHMSGCESLSARAGAFVTEVALRVERGGLLTDEVTVTLPEELHTGSPREAFCPNSTATSRPPG
ncbi:MAG: hypothetical protein H6529_04050 [Nocardioides sp.]|nr:hypothetical protein [Nocardioidaceae bacterium]MCB8955632.1 hypothetical protein [Nocardioides sp.]